MTAESNDNVNDIEKDESGKDNDGASVFSDADGSRGNKQGTLCCVRVSPRLSNFRCRGEKSEGTGGVRRCAWKEVTDGPTDLYIAISSGARGLSFDRKPKNPFPSCS